MSDQEHHQLQKSCYEQWMEQQAERLNQLQQALTEPPTPDDNRDSKITELVGIIIHDFEEYIDKRNRLTQRGRHASRLFAPPWNSPLENSLMWIAGCRPSSYIRLLYALCGSMTSSGLTDLMGDAHIVPRPLENAISVRDLSAKQLGMVNELHIKTVREEDRLTSRQASLQEDTADIPIAIIARGQNHIGEATPEVDHALNEHQKMMSDMLEEADSLRMNTLKELISIIKPIQAAEYLVASKKLHLCMHAWGKKRG